MECDIALESLQGNPASRCAGGGILRSFSSCDRKPCVCSTCDGDLRELLLCLLEVRNTVDLGGASRNPLVLVQWKSASSRVEAGTSGFLFCSDVGFGLYMPFQTGSQVWTCVEEWNSAFLSSCGRKPCVPSTCDGDFRELLRVPMGSQEYCGVGRGLSGFHWVWCNGRGPHRDLKWEPQGSSPVLTWVSGCVCHFKQGVRSRRVWRHGTLLSSRAVKGVSALQPC